MTDPLRYLIVILIAYLLGCLNPAYVIGRIKGVDVHALGSKNPGASNTMALMGWKFGILVGVHDIAKAVLATWLCFRLFPTLTLCREIAGVSCVLGHMFPFYLRFRGGKGFASMIGMIAVLNWKFMLIMAVGIVLITLITDYIVLGTLTTALAYPSYCLLTHQVTAAVLMAALAALIFYKHRENIVRIIKGTEPGLHQANRGELRADKQPEDEP